MKTSRQSSYQIWRWPAVIAALSIFGLLSALLGQSGIWWALSWAALAAPLVVSVWCAVKSYVAREEMPSNSLLRR